MQMSRAKHTAIWLRMLAAREISFARDAKKLFKAQATACANVYEREASFPAVEQVLKEGKGQWHRLLVAHYTIAIKEFVDYTKQELTGSKSTKQNFQTVIQNYITKQGLVKSVYITDTTIDQARKVVNQGQLNGNDEKAIGKSLEDQIGGLVSDYRATRIARTEVHNAATFGMQITAEETENNTGIDLTREWVTVEDDRTREAHAEADGQVRGIDEPFDVDDEEIDRPGEGSAENAINCRCTLIYYASNGDETDDPGDSANPEDYLDA